MSTQIQVDLPTVVEKDLQRNRDGRLSSRQWMELATEPVITLLSLSVPLILLVGGRFGIAGRYIVLLAVVAVIITVVLRAVRFARVSLQYQVLYLEQPRARWKFWQKLQLVTKTGESVRFDNSVANRLDLNTDQALQVYYFEIGNRRTLVSGVPQKHLQAHRWQPTDLFTRQGGKIHS